MTAGAGGAAADGADGADGPGAVGRRVRVTSVDPVRIERSGRRAAEPPEALFTRGLVRSQLRLGLSFLASFVLLLAGLTVLVAVVPGLDRIAIAGVPVPWFVHAYAFYPVAIGHAVVYGIAARRLERRFRSLLGTE